MNSKNAFAATSPAARALSEFNMNPKIFIAAKEVKKLHFFYMILGLCAVFVIKKWAGPFLILLPKIYLHVIFEFYKSIFPKVVI